MKEQKFVPAWAWHAKDADMFVDPLLSFAPCSAGIDLNNHLPKTFTSAP
jgi:hypothetical protein